MGSEQVTEGAYVESYIGDGVYVKERHGNIELWTEREDGKHWMELGPEELVALFRFIKDNWPDAYSRIINKVGP